MQTFIHTKGRVRPIQTVVATCIATFATLAIALMLTLGGCAPTHSSLAADLENQYKAGSAEVFQFTDSAGRQVVLPVEIERISPSGSYAQLMLSSFCPDLLVSLSSRFANSQVHYLGEQLQSLPVLGRYYGKNADLNYEEIIKVNPQVIIDIGEAKDNIANDMDGLQEQTGLPVIFIEATLPRMNVAYDMLGQALHRPEQAAEYSSYISYVLNFAALHQAEVAARDLRVLYGAGEYGLDVVEQGSVHSGAIDLLGANNVAVLHNTNSTLVDIEQVMLWAPNVVLLSPAEGYFLDIYDDSVWASVPALQRRQVYEVPAKPYEWLNKPPSIQTVLGIQWLGNLLAPDIYNFDMLERAQEFYKLFWHYDLSATEARELMANSTFYG